MLPIPDHPYRILIIGDSGSGKTTVSLNLIRHQRNIYKIYLYAKDLYEAKYKLLINKRDSVVFKYCDDSKSFIEFSDDVNDIYENIDETI